MRMKPRRKPQSSAARSWFRQLTSQPLDDSQRLCRRRECHSLSSSTFRVSESLSERVKQATELLEEIAGDRAILAEVEVADRNRLLQAAGQVSRPDVIDRRRLLKVSKRKRKAER